MSGREDILVELVGGLYDGLVRRVGWTPAFWLARPCIECRLMGTEAVCRGVLVEVDATGPASGNPRYATYRLESSDDRQATYVHTDLHLAPRAPENRRDGAAQPKREQ